MRPHLGLLFLWKRAQMRKRQTWSRERLIGYQAQQLQRLRTYAYARSPFYRRFHKGLEEAPLNELPVLTKQQLIENFDEIVTDRRVTLRALDEHVACRSPGTRFRHRYWICATSGTTGRHAIIPYGFSEWATLLASHVRVNDWAGVRWKGPRLRVGIVGADSRWHQSAAAPHSLRSLFAAIKRTSPADPIPDISARLNESDPDVLVSFAGMIPVLVDEALSGRLAITPQAVVSVAEILTPKTRRLVRKAWNLDPYDMYASTEAAGMAADCANHTGMHFFEDLIIPEVVDENDRPVPPGNSGTSLLTSVLYSRTVPLIRYRLDDCVTLGAGDCSCGRPFGRITRVEGRVAETLRFPLRDGSVGILHPVRFGSIFDTLALSGWQVVKHPHCLTISLLAPVTSAVMEEVRSGTEQLLHELGVEGFEVDIKVASHIPRHTSGKVTLVRDDSRPPESVSIP
jgi:phenylacetate-CoA ligase